MTPSTTGSSISTLVDHLVFVSVPDPQANAGPDHDAETALTADRIWWPCLCFDTIEELLATLQLQQSRFPSFDGQEVKVQLALQALENTDEPGEELTSKTAFLLGSRTPDDLRAAYCRMSEGYSQRDFLMNVVPLRRSQRSRADFMEAVGQAIPILGDFKKGKTAEAAKTKAKGELLDAAQDEIPQSKEIGHRSVAVGESSSSSKPGEVEDEDSPPRSLPVPRKERFRGATSAAEVADRESEEQMKEASSPEKELDIPNDVTANTEATRNKEDEVVPKAPLAGVVDVDSAQPFDLDGGGKIDGDNSLSPGRKDAPGKATTPGADSEGNRNPPNHSAPSESVEAATDPFTPPPTTTDEKENAKKDAAVQETDPTLNAQSPSVCPANADAPRITAAGSSIVEQRRYNTRRTSSAKKFTTAQKRNTNRATVRSVPSSPEPESDSGGSQSPNNWIQCDKCGKWRLLVGCRTIEDLLEKAWDCSMNESDPRNSSCDAPQRVEDWYDEMSEDDCSESGHTPKPTVPAANARKESLSPSGALISETDLTNTGPERDGTRSNRSSQATVSPGLSLDDEPIQDSETTVTPAKLPSSEKKTSVRPRKPSPENRGSSLESASNRTASFASGSKTRASSIGRSRASDTSRTSEYSPNFNDVKATLEKAGYVFTVDGHYCRPMEDGKTVPEDGRDRFDNERIFREHLCEYGVNGDHSQWTEDERKSVATWVRHAIVKGFDGEYLPQYDRLSLNETWPLLQKLGFSYVKRKAGSCSEWIACPGVGGLGWKCSDNLPGQNIFPGLDGNDGVLLHLAKHGLPENCHFEQLTEHVRLSLELFLSESDLLNTL